MTRKDYKKFAELIRDFRHPATPDATAQERDTRAELFDRFADEFALILGRDNPRFDRECFLKACGIE